MIGVQAAKKTADIPGELVRMLREAEVSLLHGDILVKVRCEHGKPVVVTTMVEARAKL